MRNLVVKDNALINASYSLSLVEQRLILLAIVAARKTKVAIDSQTTIKITASSYIEQFGTQRNAAYQALKDACNNLFNRYFTYQEKDGGIVNVKSRWVSKIGYVDATATVKITFAPDVIPLVTELENRFTQYELEQISGLSSAYAVRLYELLIAWRSTGHMPKIELQQLRSKLGVAETEYKLMHQFKQRVLDLAIAQINEQTDINVSYEQHKKGRTIYGFSFTFKFKKSKNKTNSRSKNEENIPLPLSTPKTKNKQDDREKTADLEHLKRLAELGGVPVETLLKRP